MGSYVLFRDWERFGPLLLRHPSLLALDTFFGSLLLISAGPDTTLAQTVPIATAATRKRFIPSPIIKCSPEV